MLRFDLITIFPEFFSGPLDFGIVRRAREAGLAEMRVHDLRQWAHDRHRTVDDRPFGGGEGMVLKADPLFEAVEEVLGAPQPASDTAIVLLSAAGRLFRQPDAHRLARKERIVLLCGRYEGVDERVAEHLATDELCIGDFVLSGGELPAAAVLDAAVRLIPGAVGNEASTVFESFRPSEMHSESNAGGEARRAGPEFRMHPARDAGATASRAAGEYVLLDCPHYTRPAEFRGWPVPEVLMSGHHEEIRRWRRRAALEKTLRNRPDLLAGAVLTPEDAALLRG
jgi:tRNA (guanine37-N1)-methyltransferase